MDKKMDLKNVKAKRFKTSITVISIMMIAIMVYFSAMPVEVQAAGTSEYANTSPIKFCYFQAAA